MISSVRDVLKREAEELEVDIEIYRRGAHPSSVCLWRGPVLRQAVAPVETSRPRRPEKRPVFLAGFLFSW